MTRPLILSFLLAYSTLLIAQTSPNNYYNVQTSNSKDRTFAQAISIGINYQTVASTIEELDFSQTTFDAQIDKFGFSFYAPFGFFVSGYKNKQDKLPAYFYDENILSGAKEILVKNGLTFEDVHTPEINENLFGLSGGLYIAPFFKNQTLKYVHLMGGVSYLKGMIWDSYSGDLNPILNYSYYATNQYAINKNYYDSYGAIGGLALVFPFVQIEGVYNANTEEIYLNLGVNLPFEYIINKSNSTL